MIKPSRVLSYLKADSHRQSSLLASLKQRILEQRAIEEPIPITLTKPKKASKNKKELPLLEASDLYKEFKTPFQILPSSEQHVSATNNFFNDANVQFLWSVSKFEDIPDIKWKAEIEKYKNVRDTGEADFKPGKSFSLDEIDAIQKPEELEELKAAHFEKNNKKKPRISPDLIRPMPEVVFLGRCNVGKSSLLNSISTQLTQRSTKEYAFASKRAGFTTEINCFSVGKRVSIVDTPGYGKKSNAQQGNEILKYLHQRKELKKVYVLISAVNGFNENDLLVILGLLGRGGFHYGIIFTKIDKLKSPDRLRQVISNLREILNENGIEVEPDYFFTSSVAPKGGKRQGITEIRFDILNSCGLPIGIKPTKGAKR